MPQEFKITQVSNQEPRVYNGQYGTTYYITVHVEGHDKPVSVGKKAPDALRAGMTIYGTIQPTEFDADNFKAERRPDQPFGGAGTPDRLGALDKRVRVLEMFMGKGRARDSDSEPSEGISEPRPEDYF